ncbi:MAG: transposase [Gammaproteobacteria bacterium]|nr:transposase [Gammaproteobacteria bacterium]
MSNQRYTPAFKQEVICQVIARGHTVAGIAELLGVSAISLYNQIKAVNPGEIE